MDKSIEIHYEKNPLYRTIYSDGAIGGITPANQVNLCFYATRVAIPKAVEYQLNEEGLLLKEIGKSKDSKSGIVREIELGVYMNRQSAKELYVFLKNIFEDDKV